CMVSYKGDLYKLLLVQIMAASAIIISFDSSDESVGSPPSWVILFGDIPTVIPSTSVIAPETYAIAHVISSATHVVETTLVASITDLLGGVHHLVLQTIAHLLLVYLRILRQFILQVWMHEIRLILDLRLGLPSESSSGDSSERPLHSSSHYTGLSRKRCRSPTNYVPSSTPVIGS
nr:hypothetical protein [Tanacetum cinerariifolium]